jgi:hypothetical protein
VAPEESVGRLEVDGAVTLDFPGALAALAATKEVVEVASPGRVATLEVGEAATLAMAEADYSSPYSLVLEPAPPLFLLPVTPRPFPVR